MDQKPVMVNDRTLVALRAIFESLGATVSWNDTAQTVIITSSSDSLLDMNFNNLSEFVYIKDYICGGAYEPKYITLSNDFDHTTGSGKSVKMDTRTSQDHRLKIVNASKSVGVPTIPRLRTKRMILN